MKTAKKSNPAAKTAAKTAAAPASKPKKQAPGSSKAARKHQKAAAPASPPEITEVEIATCAYFIYVSEGCPAGREMDHWLQAEARLRSL